MDTLIEIKINNTHAKIKYNNNLKKKKRSNYYNNNNNKKYN
jgi:hypothetical protein